MNKIYYLSTCDTCKRIITELELKEKGFVFQDIKTEKITAAQLEEMKEVACALSKNLLFCRVDLYIHDHQVYFGEVTLIPGGGNEPFLPQEYDEKIGSLMNIHQ